MGLLDTPHMVCLFARTRVVGRELWTWDVWRTIAAAVSPWIDEPEAVETRSHQTVRATRRSVSLPSKLGWNEAAFAKWTHRSPTTASTSAGWIFSGTFFHLPAWSTCVERDVAPRAYVEIKSRPMGGKDLELLVVSISTEVLGGEGAPAALLSTWSELRPSDPSASLAAWTVRPFVRRDRSSLVRCVDEITHNELDGALTLETLQAGCDAMDRRCRVTSHPWALLPIEPAR